MVRKEDTKLLQWVDQAIAAMDQDEPGWRTLLSSQYYEDQLHGSLHLSQNEKKYLDQLKKMEVFYGGGKSGPLSLFLL